MERAYSVRRRARPSIGAALIAVALLAGCSGSGGLRQTLADTTPTRMSVAKTALAKVGDRYAKHMAGPDQFDDSGLAYYVYRRSGHALPRGIASQIHTGTPIALSAARPGDLVFFRVDGPNGHAHLTVGIIIDAHLAVVAQPDTEAKPEGSVRRVSLDKGYWAARLVGVARVLPVTKGSSHT